MLFTEEFPTFPHVLIPHQVGTEGPWWCDCHEVLPDSTLGLIVHSTGFYHERHDAVRAGQAYARTRAGKLSVA